MNGLALFAGVAGLELGIQLALPSSRTVCFVEAEAYAASVLVSQMEKGGLHEAPIWADVVTFDGKPWRGKVDFISAGFPCQPWSKAGKLEKTEDERWLWDDILRIICEVGPQYIFLENVPGIIDGGISHILEGLAKVGFNVEWDLLRASEVGANHQRQRAFIFAYCNSRGCSISNADLRLFTREVQQIRPRGNFSSSSGSDVPDSHGERRNENELNTSTGKPDPIRGGSNVSDTGCKPGQIQTSRKFASIQVAECPTWWQIEPPVGRVVDGLAYRVDRLRACGNGVVPLQAAVAYSELIKRAEGGLK